MKCTIKGDPSRMPAPMLPPTKPVDIGSDKMDFTPSVWKMSSEPKTNNWTDKDERILQKLKSAGMKDKDIAKKMGRTLNSVKWKVKMLRGKGQL